MIEHIPRELQEIPQWVAAGENKVPINPTNGRSADPTDPGTWGTFAQAKATGLKHIGFVLHKDDPYAIIDLDDPFQRPDKTRIEATDHDYGEACERVKRHAKFMELFDSYTEISQSGQGMHIVIKGSVPKGVRRDKVEIYSAERYMIFTGKVFRDSPVMERQELLTLAFNEMNTTTVTTLVDETGILSDSDVLRLAMGASNADKFNALCRGEWESMMGESGMALYSSQSEADLALMTILAYYTRDNEQVRRLFRYSALGQREKAQRDDYLNYALSKIRGKQPPLVDMSLLCAAPSQLPETQPALPDEPYTQAPANVKESAETFTPEPANVKSPSIEFPPGIIGELARFGMEYAIRPVPEVALAAAIGLAAGVVGRSYNISSTGLNQYVVLLAKTGSGKEAIAQIIDAMISATRVTVPSVDMFIGPAAFASGQGLIRSLSTSPCYVSVMGEFGITINSLSKPNANSAEVMLKKVLLDLYGKSGWHQTLRSTVYADKEKDTKIVQAPSLSIVGESTPEEFWDGLSEEQVASGLIPRIHIVEYTGGRPVLNENPFQPPNEALVRKFADLASVAIATQQNAQCAPVSMDSEARRMFKEFNKWVDRQFEDGSEAQLQLWNRAHLKALKLAGLVAVGCNPHSPTVNAEVAAWAIEFTKRGTAATLARFARGDVGQGYAKQFAIITQYINEYFKMSESQRKNYKAPASVLDKQIVHLAYLSTKVRMNRAFAAANQSPRQLLEKVLGEMVESEILHRVPLDQAVKEFGTRTPLYVPGVHWTALPVTTRSSQ